MRNLFVFMVLVLAQNLPARADFILYDVGVIGLMSHDIFAWNHETEINSENGRLDLSTIFDFENGQRWEKGGNPKNSENAPVYTVTMNLVQYYKERLKITQDPVRARQETVRLFHEQLKESYQRAFGVAFPISGVDEKPNNHEQAALRSLHDILPGRIALYDRFGRKELKLTNFLTAKTHLNEKELLQSLKNFDGDYDQEYKEISIPMSTKKLNLKEIDGKFIEKFSPYKQAAMLAELKRVGQGEMALKDVSYAHEFVSMFAKAVCAKNNLWMPTEIPCN